MLDLVSFQILRGCWNVFDPRLNSRKARRLNKYSFTLGHNCLQKNNKLWANNVHRLLHTYRPCLVPQHASCIAYGPAFVSFFFLLPFLSSPPISSLSSTQPTKRAKPVMPRPTRICGGKDADKVGAKQQPSSRLSGGVQGAVPCGAGDSEGFVSLMPQNKVM
jgi:hypothetical protein